jgi:hypothetical protein
MSLQELLGEELYNQVLEKAGDKKIAIVSDGSWFPKAKFDVVNDDNKDLKQQLKDRDFQLEELGKKAKGNEVLEKQIKDLQKQNDDAAKDYQAKLDKQAFDFALERALGSAQAKNPKAVKALLNIDSIKLDGEQLLGLEDQLKALKESDSYLFTEEQPPGLRGRTPVPPPGNNPPAAKNPWSKEHFNLTEQGRILKEDPELAKQYQAQAK